MNGSEWSAILDKLHANWKNSRWDPDTQDLAWDLLNRFPATQVAVGLVQCMRQGREFPPNPGQLLAAVEGAATTGTGTTFAEAWGAVKHAVGFWGWQRETQARAELAKVHLANALVDALSGWTEVCTAGAWGGDKPTGAESQHWQAEHAWKDLVQQESEDRIARGTGTVRAREAEARLQVREDQEREYALAARELERQEALRGPAQPLAVLPPAKQQVESKPLAATLARLTGHQVERSKHALTLADLTPGQREQVEGLIAEGLPVPERYASAADELQRQGATRA